MLDTMSRYLQGYSAPKDAYLLTRVLGPSVDRLSSQALVSAALAIGTSTSTAKIGAAAFYAVANGRFVSAATQDLPQPVGLNLTTGQYGIGCWFVDSGGLFTFAPGVVGATANAAGFPQFPPGKALVGFVVVTMAGTFTGGTTALSAGTTFYLSPVGAFDPTAVL